MGGGTHARQLLLADFIASGPMNIVHHRRGDPLRMFAGRHHGADA